MVACVLNGKDIILTGGCDSGESSVSGDPLNESNQRDEGSHNTNSNSVLVLKKIKRGTKISNKTIRGGTQVPNITMRIQMSNTVEVLIMLMDCLNICQTLVNVSCHQLGFSDLRW